MGQDVHTEDPQTGPRSAPAEALVAFLLGGARCALRLAEVDRVLPMVAVTPVPGAPPVVHGAINVHGEPVAVVDAGSRLGQPVACDDPDARLLLVRPRRRPLALAVDEVLGAVEVPAEAVRGAREALPGVSRLAGVAADEDGLLLIGDLERLLSDEEERALAAALEEGGHA